MNKLKLIIILLLAIPGMVACNSNVPPLELEPLSIKLSWMDGVQFMGFYAAEERGFYEEEGIAITIISTSDPQEFPGVIERVADGEFDFSLISNSGFQTALENDVSVTVFSSIIQFTPNVFFANASSGITTPADFEGRTIAVKNEVWQAVLEDFLATADLTIDDVVAVESGFGMTPFYDGDVEIWAGFLTNEPIRARQEGLEIVTFPMYEYVQDNTSVAIFTSQEIIKNNPELAVRFLRATLHGWQWSLDNPEEAIDLLIERFPELADEKDFHLASLESYIPLIRPLEIPIGFIDCEKWVQSLSFDNLETGDTFCAAEIFEQATQ